MNKIPIEEKNIKRQYHSSLRNWDSMNEIDSYVKDLTWVKAIGKCWNQPRSLDNITKTHRLTTSWYVFCFCRLQRNCEAGHHEIRLLNVFIKERFPEVSLAHQLHVRSWRDGVKFITWEAKNIGSFVLTMGKGKLW